jgi:hypothetical protein
MPTSSQIGHELCLLTIRHGGKLRHQTNRFGPVDRPLAPWELSKRGRPGCSSALPLVPRSGRTARHLITDQPKEDPGPS